MTVTRTRLRSTTKDSQDNRRRSTGATNKTGALDQLASSPIPYNYFHDSGKICAPWNRLASNEDGPHKEWVLADWQSNPYTMGTTTLSAMVLRIHTELMRDRYKGRRQ